MNTQQESIRIEFEPYRGVYNDVTDGKNTLLKLYTDRLDYKLQFKATTYLETNGGGEMLKEDVNYFMKGTICKDSIKGIKQAIVTILQTEDVDGNALNGVIHNLKRIIILYTNSADVEFEFQNKEDWEKTYKEIYNWKFNITNEKNNNN